MESIHTVIRNFKLNVVDIRLAPDSYSSEVYKLQLVNGDHVYAKIPYNKDKLFREYRILQQLSDVLPVPRIIDFWEGDDVITGAFLLTEMSGHPCNEKMSDALSYQVGLNHAKLHEVTGDVYGAEFIDGYHPLVQNDWRLYIRRTFENQKEACRGLLNETLYEHCVLHFDEVLSSLPDPDGPSLIHMDFRPGNILIDGDEVTGIIDFESARMGSTEIDFTKIHRYVWQANPSSQSAYIKGYTSVRPMIDLTVVLPFYNFYDAFSAVAWCKKRGIEKNQAMLHESIAILEKAVEGKQT